MSTAQVGDSPESPPAIEIAPTELLEPMTQRRVLRLALPIIGEYLLQACVVAASTLMVGMVGPTALAAVSIAMPVIFVLLAVFSAISVGATVLVAQAVGRGDPRVASHLARQALAWGVVLAVPLSIATYLISPTLVHAFGSDRQVQALAASYLQVIGATSVVMFMSYICGSILRGTGDGRTPLKAAMLANVLNLLTCYLLIPGRFGLPELGVLGAAWGQVIGRGAGAAFMLAVLWWGSSVITLRGRHSWRPRVTDGRTLLGLGLPAAVEQIAGEGGYTVTSMAVASLGVAAMGGFQISFTALEFWYMPALALSVTGTALVGQSVGARRPQDARYVARLINRWVVAWMLGGLVLFAAANGMILSLFTQDAAVMEAGRVALLASGVSLPVWGLWLTTTGSLRGTGDTRSPMIRGVLGTWIAVALAWIGIQWLDLGAGWVWLSYVFTMPAVAIGNWRAFQRRTGTREDAALGRRLRLRE
jgi:MATE family multidrug resistance protein